MRCPEIIKEAMIAKRLVELFSGSRLKYLKAVGRSLTKERIKIIAARSGLGLGIVQTRQFLPGWGEEKKKRKVKGEPNVLVNKDIPLISNLPENHPAKFKKMLEDKLLGMRKTTRRPHVLFTAKDLGGKKLEDIGFKLDRMNIPMPKHLLFGKSWRAGRLHLHKYGPVYIAHRDDTDPRTRNLGNVIKHNVTDTPKDVYTRWIKKEKSPVKIIKKVTAGER